MHDARGFLERESSEKQIVDQAEDRGVQTNPEREGNDGDGSERGRLSKFAKSKANIVHGSDGLSCFMKIIRPVMRGRNRPELPAAPPTNRRRTQQRLK